MALKDCYLSKESLVDMQPYASDWKTPNCCFVTVRNVGGLLNDFQQKDPTAALFPHRFHTDINRVHPSKKHVAVATIADGKQ